MSLDGEEVVSGGAFQESESFSFGADGCPPEVLSSNSENMAAPLSIFNNEEATFPSAAPYGNSSVGDEPQTPLSEARSDTSYLSVDSSAFPRSIAFSLAIASYVLCWCL